MNQQKKMTGSMKLSEPKPETNQVNTDTKNASGLKLPVDEMKEDIKDARGAKISEAQKGKKRGTYKSKAQKEQEQAEKEQEAMMLQLMENSLVVVFELINNIVKSRVKNWTDLSLQEKQSLSKATSAVVNKYMPKLENYGEEFALTLVVLGVVGARLPKLMQKEKTETK